MRTVRHLLFGCMLFVLAGCAANMPLTANQDTLDLSNESIALVSVKVANQYKSSYQPGMMYAFFFPEGEDGEKTHIDIKTDPVVSEDYKYNEYILNFSLKPGTYNFAAIWGQYQVPLLLNATCVIPLNLKVEIKPNCVSYLGHIDAVIRKRNNDEEQRAGAVVPLLDQAVVGFSGGTFDVAISDQYGEDMGRFLAKYPALNNVTVEKNVLSQWVRPKLMSEAAE